LDIAGALRLYRQKTEIRNLQRQHMLNAQDTQYTLAEDGRIFYQKQAGNPLPGEAVAILEKGSDVLTPGIVILDAAAAGQDKTALLAHLHGWLARHIAAVLEPLVGLKDAGEVKEPVKEIARHVYEALGIVPREQLESLIAALDADDRRDLRFKKIRLGPVLVFIPALNKPAAVRLRALLWGVWNGKDLPVECPKDGIVSFEIDPEAADRPFYQAIAYPVYGRRAIRIDMLDRVISAVYDGAKDGKFKAEHKMAEWLGSTIEGLYDVLEAMGHKKVYDPAREAEEAAEKQPEKVDKDEADKESLEEKETPSAEKPTQQEKPELATFRLKKGKAFEKSSASAAGKPPKKNFVKKDKFEKSKGKRNKSTNRTPKVMSAPARKIEDSPFAVLEQLKKPNEKS
jgi:ATP-dependent RNA helicase SUPV3L1/SUV3